MLNEWMKHARFERNDKSFVEERGVKEDMKDKLSDRPLDGPFR